MVTLMRAPNPSAMTLSGTNSYIVDCNGDAVIIDPGPPMTRHVDALLGVLSRRGLHLGAIVLTHGHPDHAPAALPLSAQTGAPIYAHPLSNAQHDRALTLESTLHVGAVALQVVDAPGHTFEHVVLYEPIECALFTGDVILGEGTVVIAPPGGAMRLYQHTLHRLGTEFRAARTIYGGHGPRVDDPAAKIAEYIAHREQRERELIAALREGPRTIPQLVTHIYGEERSVLWPAMARQMLAYLNALEEEGRVRAHTIARHMDDREQAILNPPWESIVGHEHAEMVRAELGAMLELNTLHSYELTAE